MNDIEKRAETIKILDILAEYFEAYTDQELAQKLGSTRNTISKWRFFNQVPKNILVKYKKIIEKNLLLVNKSKSQFDYNIKDMTYFTPYEVAEKLKIPTLDIISFIQDGSLKTYNFGKGNYRISEDQLKEFLQNQEE